MSKPLELVVNHKDRVDPDMVVVKDYWEYRPYDSAKRLTDAELAAEHQAAVLAVYRARVHHDDADWAKRLGQMQAMYRFATHPSYNEESE